MSSVWRAGPQPRCCDFSVACWTPTAILRVQCGVPDPTWDPASSVWRAGPQLRSREFRAVCRTPIAIMRVVFQDESSLVPAAVEIMMLYRSMRARQDEGLDPGSYFHAGELMGHVPILLIAGDFLQIKPANEISANEIWQNLYANGRTKCRPNIMQLRRL